jgi:hypothetical protein
MQGQTTTVCLNAGGEEHFESTLTRATFYNYSKNREVAHNTNWHAACSWALQGTKKVIRNFEKNTWRGGPGGNLNLWMWPLRVTSIFPGSEFKRRTKLFYPPPYIPHTTNTTQPLLLQHPFRKFNTTIQHQAIRISQLFPTPECITDSTSYKTDYRIHVTWLHHWAG